MKAHPLADLFPLIEGSDFDALVDDVRAHGLRERIVILDGMILDGRNRFRAGVAAELFSDGDPPTPGSAGFIKWFGLFDCERDGDPLAYVLSLNLSRRHLNESQRAMIAARLATMKWGGARQDANLHLVSRADAAERLHVAPRTVAHAALVERKATAEIKRAVDQGRLAVSAASQAAELPEEQQRRIAERADAGDARAVRNIVKQEARAERERELAGKQRALPDATYGVILEDPAWRFIARSRETGLDRAADNHYPTMTFEAIVALPVASIAAKDCVYFLWTPANRVDDAIDLLRARGFDYVTQFVWGKPKIGNGYWVRDKHEVLLIGRRGAAVAPAFGTQSDSLILAPLGEHSAKPEIFLEIIERYFPNLPKIELNHRGPPRKNWAAWGNEAELGVEEDDEISRAAFEANVARECAAVPDGAEGEGRSVDAASRDDPRPDGGAAVVRYAADRSRKWDGDIEARVAGLYESEHLKMQQIGERLGIGRGEAKGLYRRFKEKRARNGGAA